MVDDVLGDLVEPIRVRNQLVLPGEVASDDFLGRLVEAGVLQHLGDLVVEIRGVQVQRWQPALAVERHGRTVGDGLGEVVDGHVVAEQVFRPVLFIALDQGRAGEGEGQEGRVGQSPSSTGREYSDGFSPELARNWSATVQSRLSISAMSNAIQSLESDVT